MRFLLILIITGNKHAIYHPPEFVKTLVSGDVPDGVMVNVKWNCVPVPTKKKGGHQTPNDCFLRSTYAPLRPTRAPAEHDTAAKLSLEEKKMYITNIKSDSIVTLQI
jgi:hypothetical protein